MKNIRINAVLVALILSLVAGSAMALECEANKIAHIYVDQNQYNENVIQIEMQDGINQKYYTLEYSHPQFDEIYANILLAMSKGYIIGFRYSVASSYGWYDNVISHCWLYQNPNAQ